MSERGEIQTPRKGAAMETLNEAQVREIVQGVWDSLVTAFAGVSQVDPATFGEALASQVINGRLALASRSTILEAAFATYPESEYPKMDKYARFDIEDGYFSRLAFHGRLKIDAPYIDLAAHYGAGDDV